MTFDPAAAASVDKALDTLIIAVSKFNVILVERGFDPVTQPQRHLPIEPFFDDMTALIIKLTERVADA